MRRFDKTEWSGPAWYRIDSRTDKGFPLKVTLVHFVPIDLGDASATEMDAEILGPMLPKIYKELPALTDAYLGMIHSHHGMGAFFSGTDEKALLEQAPQEGLFFSTVVAHTKKKYVTAVSYQDQFGFPNYVEGNVQTKFKHKSEKAWRDEADFIEEESKKNVVNTFGSGSYRGIHGNYNGYNGYYQYSAFGEDKKEKKEPKVITNQLSLTGETAELHELMEPGMSEPDRQMEAIAEAYNKFEANEITEAEFTEECRKIAPDIDPHSWVDGMGGGII